MAQSDQKTIDALLPEIYPEESSPSLNLLVYVQDSLKAEALSTYAQLFGEMLGARISVLDQGEDLDAVTEIVMKVGQDLVFCGEPCESLIDRLLFGPSDCRAADRVPTSLLIVRGFRWPLKAILVFVQPQCAETNKVALDWTIHLARSSGAAVTLLAVVPPPPAMYQGRRRMSMGLTTLLTAGTPLGQEMRRMARRLVEEEIDAKLRLRQGSPDWQIRLEVAARDYDLIVLGAGSNNRFRQWLMGGPVNPLLRWVDRPVLIAKSS